MNKRIRELAKQAEFSEKDLHIQGDNFQRFAELIVLECIEVCGSMAAVKAGYNDADGRDTAYSCGDQIKEHFGIE